jgi:hypothetical protein
MLHIEKGYPESEHVCGSHTIYRDSVTEGMWCYKEREMEREGYITQRKSQPPQISEIRER